MGDVDRKPARETYPVKATIWKGHPHHGAPKGGVQLLAATYDAAMDRIDQLELEVAQLRAALQ